MKNILILVLGLMALTMTSCYEESDWISENSTTEGKHYAQIQGVSIMDGATYTPGSTITVLVDYWSIDDVSKLDLKQDILGVESDVSSTPYADHFDKDKNVQVMPIPYTIPSDVEAGTDITLTVDVVTTTGLVTSKSKTITVE